MTAGLSREKLGTVLPRSLAGEETVLFAAGSHTLPYSPLAAADPRRPRTARGEHWVRQGNGRSAGFLPALSRSDFTSPPKGRGATIGRGPLPDPMRDRDGALPGRNDSTLTREKPFLYLVV